jgi:ubiquinone/menaquinone biosynthesis C-methylase UbiE
MHTPLVNDELDWLDSMVGLSHQDIIELGCGAAALARQLLTRFPQCHLTALEVDERQQAKNLLATQQRLTFVQAGAQAIPCEAASFDLALMLKSLHHVPVALMDAALLEVHRVLRPEGLLYVSEPVFAGSHNEVMRLFHDEEQVRIEALQAVHRAVASAGWVQQTEIHFEMPVHYHDFADFEKRMMAVTYADHRLDEATMQKVRARFESHMGSQGADFMRPMRVNLLQKDS